jgi:hypothetical protein
MRESSGEPPGADAPVVELILDNNGLVDLLYDDWEIDCME